MTEQDLIKEWRKTPEGKMEWTGRYIRKVGYINSGMYSGDDPLVFVMEDEGNDRIPLRFAWDVVSEEDLKNIGKGTVALSAEISKTFYPLFKKSLEDYYNASRTHDVASGEAETEKTGGSEP